VKLDHSAYLETYTHEEFNEETYLKETIYTTVEKTVSGNFVLLRTLDGTVWETIHKFALLGDKLSRWSWKDFTVEQGKTYTYAIQEYNDYGLYSDKVLSKEIYVDFEDAFLFDGEKQLKIKYNPKVNSFKTDHLESKVETIGSKFPFIFRNG
jgi:hypothetical protein